MTPCASCSDRTNRPTSTPMTRSSGTLSGATTSTAIPRARSDAATSRPMKLAPTTTTRSAPLRPLDDRAAVGERCADRAHGRSSAPGIGQPHGIGAGREQQRAVRGDPCRRRDVHGRAGRIDRRHTRPSTSSMRCST